MADNNKILNYVSGNAVYLFDTISNSTIAQMSSDLNELINSIKPLHSATNFEVRNPHNIPDNISVIDVFISSSGGELRAYSTIMGLLSIAKSRGTIIRTNVFGRAGSAASMIAIQGTPGMRIMQENSEHHAHFGRFPSIIEKSTEIDKVNALSKQHHKFITQTYLNNTKIIPEELAKLIEDEQGILNAKQCKKFGFCDWILYNDGSIKTR